MKNTFTFPQFVTKFTTDDFCLEEIKRLRYPHGIYCETCKKITRHYKLTQRISYACKFCRKQVYPLVGTIFEKSSTPLRIWFYALFLMTHTRADISIRQLQKELGVTYKTAWRMYTRLYGLMEQNGGDLLRKPDTNILRWTFFNKFEIKVVEKDETTE